MKSIIAFTCFSLLFFCEMTAQDNVPNFDWQGHRGCRGLLPENTVPAFIHALSFNVSTLELDLAVSKDNQLIVSHEPWMSHHICTKPNGEAVTKKEAMTLRIMEMDYEEIKKYDCGTRGNERFPQQKKMAVYKPSLRDVVEAVNVECEKNQKAVPNYNIEIKSRPEGDNLFHPAPAAFAKMVLDEITDLKIKEKTCVQSFDVRPLQELKKIAPDVTLALLVENEDSFQENIDRLGFQPDIYSCYYKLLKRKHIKKLHRQGIRVIPWTVNNSKDMKKLIRKKVDGIITDYPNLIAEIEAK
ncbi:MAG: glycerophosphodiester phosphodiesterase family protein [Bacteroidota bacterium]